MTISASIGPADSDRLSWSLELYRDLSRTLGERIAQLKSALPFDSDCKHSVAALRSHHRALQTVLELEARLGTYRSAGVEGESAMLNLDDSRTEIAARLAVWRDDG